MSEEPTTGAGFSRRLFLGTTLSSALLPAGIAQATPAPMVISDEGITLTAAPDGSVTVRDGVGVNRIKLARVTVKDSVAGSQASTGATPSIVPLPDGRNAIQIDYTFPSAANGITVRGRFDVTPHRAHLHWDITGPATLLPTGFMIGRTVLSPSAPESSTTLAKWNRDQGGGVPYETDAGVVYQETWSDTKASFLLASSRPDWTSTSWLHAPGTAVTGGASVDVDLVLGSMRPAAAGAIGVAQPLGVEVWTDQAFNLWNSAGQPMNLHTQIANGGTTSRSVKLSWWARDFDGQVVGSRTVTSTLAPGTVQDHTFTVTSPARGIVFTEASVTAGTDEAFARTTLTVLPNYNYQAGDTSMFGLANYPWLLRPNADSVLGLIRLLGIKWMRIAYDGAPGLPLATLDAAGIAHNVELAGIPLGGTPAAIAAWADTNTAVAINSRARYFEVGNELNRPFGSDQTAAAYVSDGLRPVRDRLTAAGAPTKVLNNGIAGMDHVWTRKFHEVGGWDLIDGFAFHPGRGNFTPDYAPAPVDWTMGPNGTYWNFLGGVRKANQLITEYGHKELWLTEAYACTKPNSWWHDTYRHAAENVLLTLALAKAEGVRCVNWYQLHDSRLGKPQIANPTDSEYHYGLMNRDTSAKPSMLAYATAARILDQATFDRWLTLSDPELKGLLFRTPTGPMSILWSRKDGYVLNADHPTTSGYFPAPEPWIDGWPTKTNLTLCATGSTVREVDCIGRERSLTVTAGRVKVRLDGAPRIYYGLTDTPDQA